MAVGQDQLKTSVGWLELVNYTTAPIDVDTNFRGLAFVGGTLKYYNGSTFTALSGSGGVSTWDELYDNDVTLTIDQTTLTFQLTHATNNGLTLAASGAAAGAVLAFSNSGSGKDILGTSSTWDVTKAGVATFAGISISGTATAIATSAAAVWTLLDNDASALTIDASGTTGLLLFDTRNSAEVISSSATIFRMLTGKMDLIQGSNTVSALVVTDNTVTTFGAAANSAGVVVIRSTSLTTGSLLQLQTTEGTLNGGFYLTCRDVTGSANVFTVGEDGAHVIAGANGSTMFTITAGDVVMSAGSITMTDDDNAATVQITNDTATTAAVFVLAGSGTFTGSTTGSFVTITPSGLTSGTAIYLPVAALDSGKGIHVVGNALTTGELLLITHTTAVIADGGSMVRISSTSIDTGGATNGTLLDISSTAQVAGVTARLDTALTTGGALIITSSAAMTTTGYLLTLTANSATTAAGILRINGNGLTDGKGLIIASSATAMTSTGRLFHVSHTGSTSTSSILAEVSTAAADETIAFQVSASAAITGSAVKIDVSAMVSGNGLLISATEATITTGKYIACFDGAANDFSVAKYGATVIAGNALGTAALTLTTGDILVSDGNLTVAGKIIFNATETIAAGGTTTALNLAKTVHYIDADAGGDIFTLADGVAGQIMTILLTSSTGTATITPANLAGGTNVLLNADGESVVLQFMDTEWFILGGNGYVIS